jgi:hypothetical protein
MNSGICWREACIPDLVKVRWMGSYSKKIWFTSSSQLMLPASWTAASRQVEVEPVLLGEGRHSCRNISSGFSL